MWSALPSGARGWVAYGIACEAVALVLTVAGLLLWHEYADMAWFGVLLVLAVGQAELSRRIERERRGISAQTHINVTTVWFVAGAAMLTPGWAGLLAIATYTHLWWRVWRAAGNWPFNRMVVSAAILTISSWAGSAALQFTPLGSLRDAEFADFLPLVLVAAVTLEIANAAIAAAAVSLRTGSRTPRDLFGTWQDNALELVTLCLGALTALLLASPWPTAVLLIFPPLLILHRAALSDQLEALATTDTKTSVYNSSAWQQQAQRALLQAQRGDDRSALLMIDVDNFKKVNDTYGHLAGDDVLREIAATINVHVRGHDVVGRFGGEEFVVLLPSADTEDARVAAERIRVAAERLRVPIVADGSPRVIDDLSVSIGVATYPDDGTGLRNLLDAADTAVYAAKHAGRNQVMLWHEIEASRSEGR